MRSKLSILSSWQNVRSYKEAAKDTLEFDVRQARSIDHKARMSDEKSCRQAEFFYGSEKISWFDWMMRGKLVSTVKTLGELRSLRRRKIWDFYPENAR